MARYRDNSGIDNTCPKIDRVISLIDSFDPEDEAVISDLQDALILMQEIREANANLREWGNEQYDSFYEIEKERDSLSTENEILKNEIESLENKVTNLEDKVVDLRTQISDLEEEIEYQYSLQQ